MEKLHPNHGKIPASKGGNHMITDIVTWALTGVIAFIVGYEWYLIVVLFIRRRRQRK